jgi:hypothetical protein
VVSASAHRENREQTSSSRREALISAGVVGSYLLAKTKNQAALAASPTELKKKSEARKEELREKMQQMRAEQSRAKAQAEAQAAAQATPPPELST